MSKQRLILLLTEAWTMIWTRFGEWVMVSELFAIAMGRWTTSEGMELELGEEVINTVKDRGC
jgi:hypothetical protein